MPGRTSVLRFGAGGVVLIVRGLDFETTGLIGTFTATGRKIFPQITQYAIVTWQDGRIVTSEEHYIMPTIAVEPKAAEVSGFSFERWQANGATPWGPSHVHRLQGLLTNQPVCGHNVLGFDLPILEAECMRIGEPAPQWDRRVIDTQVFGVPLVCLGLLKSCSLASMCEYLGINNERPHTAAWDAWASLQIWEKFVEKTADQFLGVLQS